MPDHKDIIKQGRKIAEELEAAVESIDKTMPAVSKAISARVTKILSTLELDKEGDIIPNVANLNKLSQVQREVRTAIMNSDYSKEVEGSLSSLNRISIEQVKYFDMVQGSIRGKEKFFNALRAQATTNLKDSLVGRGLDVQIVDPLMETIRQNITEKRSLDDLVAQTRTILMGNADKAPQLQKYARQITTDILNTHAAEMNKVFTDDLGFEWFIYVGALVAASRPFCQALVSKQYVHISEFGQVAQGIINGVQVSTAGMIAGTNAQNLQVNRGGYNCNHLLLPIPSEAVPEDIKANFQKAAGLAEPEDEFAGYEYKGLKGKEAIEKASLEEHGEQSGQFKRQRKKTFQKAKEQYGELLSDAEIENILDYSDNGFSHINRASALMDPTEWNEYMTDQWTRNSAIWSAKKSLLESSLKKMELSRYSFGKNQVASPDMVGKNSWNQMMKLLKEEGHGNGIVSIRQSGSFRALNDYSDGSIVEFSRYKSASAFDYSQIQQRLRTEPETNMIFISKNRLASIKDFSFYNDESEVFLRPGKYQIRRIAVQLTKDSPVQTTTFLIEQ